jgi:hypothetical protein
MPSRLTRALFCLALTACPAPEEPELDAGQRDAGVRVDAGLPSCADSGVAAHADGGLVLATDLGLEIDQRTYCFDRGEQWALTFPARSVAILSLDSREGGVRFVVTRGAEVLFDDTPSAGNVRDGWVVAGDAEVTLRVTSPDVRLVDIRYTRTSFGGSGADQAQLADGGLGLDPRPATASPGTAPEATWPAGAPYFQFNVADAHARAANAPGCSAPAGEAVSYFAFGLDAGAWQVNNLSLPIFPDFVGRVVDARGAVLAEGVLGASLAFDLPSAQRVAFGYVALDAGVVHTCAFDGGLAPDVLFTSPRRVRVVPR